MPPSATDKSIKSNRHKSHVSRACERCRARKTKCDGERPSCAACVAVQQPCVFNIESDGRRATAADNDQLRVRVQQLEAECESLRSVATIGGTQLAAQNEALRAHLVKMEQMLHRRNISVLETFSEDGRASASPLPTYRSNGTLPVQGSSKDLEALKPDEDRAANLLHYGPTSALAHLAAAATSQRINGDAASPARAHGPLSPAMKTGDYDFARFLPPIGLTRMAHDCIIELFEAFFAHWCNVVDMIPFRQEMEERLSTPRASDDGRAGTHYSPMLHNAMLALGISYWRGPRINQPLILPGIDPTQDVVAIAAEALWRTAKSHFEEECDKPSIGTVRALLLMASYATSRCKSNLGYLYFGCSVKCAYTLGVNIEASSLVARGVIDEATKTARDCLFWTVFMQDRLWSFAMGRFLHLHPDEYNLPMPSPEASLDQTAWVAPRVWAETRSTGPTAHGKPALRGSALHATLSLTAIKDEVAQLLYSLNSATPRAIPAGQLAALDARLENWYQLLPECLSVSTTQRAPPPHVLVLHLDYYYTVILLHRPFYKRAAEDGAFESSVQRCDDAAFKVMENVHLYETLYGVGYGPLSMIQTLFATGTVLLLAAQREQAQSAPIDIQLRGVAFCTAALRRIGIIFENGYRIASLLEKVAATWLQDVDLASIGLAEAPKHEGPVYAAVNGGPMLGEQTLAPATWDEAGFDINAFDWSFSVEGINSYGLSAPTFGEQQAI